MIEFLSKVEILLLNMWKLLNFQVFPGLFSDFCSKFQVFFKISQIPGFSKFFCLNCQIQGKVATLQLYILKYLFRSLNILKLISWFWTICSFFNVALWIVFHQLFHFQDLYGFFSELRGSYAFCQFCKF